jgi:hypothetical protein
MHQVAGHRQQRHDDATDSEPGRPLDQRNFASVFASACGPGLSLA